MKNTVFVLSICLFPCFGWTQSTCETRVDAHQDSSTMQRVHYCLTPDDDTAAQNPGLVFSGVSSPRPSVSQEVVEEKATAKAGTFKPEQVGIAKVFVETRQFPQVSDHRISQQEIRAKQEGQQLAQEMLAQNQCVMPEEAAEAVSATVPAQTIEQKPARSTATKQVRKKKARRKTTKTVSVTQRTVPSVNASDDMLGSVVEETVQVDEQQLPLEATSYMPAVGEDSVENAVSYAPTTDIYGEYTPVESGEIPLGSISYAPAN